MADPDQQGHTEGWSTPGVRTRIGLRRVLVDGHEDLDQAGGREQQRADGHHDDHHGVGVEPEQPAADAHHDGPGHHAGRPSPSPPHAQEVQDGQAEHDDPDEPRRRHQCAGRIPHQSQASPGGHADGQHRAERPCATMAHHLHEAGPRVQHECDAEQEGEHSVRPLRPEQDGDCDGQQQATPHHVDAPQRPPGHPQQWLLLVQVGFDGPLGGRRDDAAGGRRLVGHRFGDVLAAHLWKNSCVCSEPYSSHSSTTASARPVPTPVSRTVTRA